MDKEIYVRETEDNLILKLAIMPYENLFYIDLYLYFSNNDNYEYIVSCLDEIDKRIRAISDDNNCYISVINNCISEYYCNKIFEKYSSFERKLRELVLIFFTAEYNFSYIDYIDKNKKINNIIKRYDKNIDKKVILEKWIEFLGFKDIVTFLFGEKSIEDSLWGKLFSKHVDDNFEKEELDLIKDYRNILMHNKSFDKAEYEEFDNLLDKFLAIVEKAISIKEKYFFEIKNAGIIAGINSMKIVLDQFSKKINYAISKNVIDTFDKINKIATPKIQGGLEKVLLSLAKAINESLKNDKDI